MRIFNNNIDMMIYQLERFGKNGSGRWMKYHPRDNDFGEAWDMYGGKGRETAPLAYEFSACGETWQRTGIFGTQRKEIAMSAFAAIIINKPNERWRLVERWYRIRTKEMIVMPATLTEAVS